MSRRSSNSRKAVVGLDIEPGAIHAAQVSVNGHIAVERAAHVALEPGVVRDGEIVDPVAVAGALRSLFAEHKLDKRVRLGVANQRVVVRLLELPVIEDPKELEVAVRFQAADQVPMSLDQAVLEHVVLGRVETAEGSRIRVLIVAARRDMIEKLIGAVQEAGLRPVGVDLAAFAMARALGTASEAPVLHLAIGGVVNLGLVQNGQCVFTRVVAGGMEAMAIELAEREGMAVEQARAELATTGLSATEPQVVAEPAPYAPTLADDDDEPLTLAAEPAVAREPETAARRVLADGIRRIAVDVRNSVDFHLGAGQVVERVVLTGSASAVPGVADALSEALGLPVEVAHIETPAGVEPGRFAVAAGLAVEEVSA